MRQSTRKEMGPSKLDANATAYQLEAFPIGAGLKNLLVFIKVLAVVGEPTVSVDIFHGPDGSMWTIYKQNLINQSVTSAPTLLAGSTKADTDGQLGECIQIGIKITGADAAVVVEVYTLPKPF